MAENKQKQKVKFSELLKKAVQGLKTGTTKQRVYAAICFLGAAALVIWWITIMVDLFQ